MKRRKQILAPFAAEFYEREVQEVCCRWYGKVHSSSIMVAVNCAAWMLIARHEKESLAWLKQGKVDPLRTYYDYPLLFAEMLLAVERATERRDSSELSWKDVAIFYSDAVWSDFHKKWRIPEGHLTHKEIAAAVSETIGEKFSEGRIRVALNRERARRVRVFMQWTKQYRRDHALPPIADDQQA